MEDSVTCASVPEEVKANECIRRNESFEETWNYLLVAIVVKLVVRPQCRQSPGTDTVREENLRGTVYPWSWGEQLLPSWSDVVK